MMASDRVHCLIMVVKTLYRSGRMVVVIGTGSLPGRTLLWECRDVGHNFACA